MAAETVPPARSAALGRPGVTTHDAIEQGAFRLFARHGFEGTTLSMIADEVGVGRRTLTRYYPSKNDIAWGRFDLTLSRFADSLAASPPEVPLHVAVHRAVLEFNRFPADASPGHRARMELILGTPELQAHSVHRYAEWRAVIAGHVAQRRGLEVDDLLPQVVGQVSLALTMSAYDHWLRTPGSDLEALLDEAMAALRGHLEA
ncbi:MAG: TetR family transcriptional regulator [Marmoricola sp.]|nr:TetR family transcriptional regulator [Marmoricola sp.]